MLILNRVYEGLEASRPVPFAVRRGRGTVLVSRGIFRKGFGLDAEARKLQGSLLPTPKKGTSMWGFSNYICTFRHGALIKFQILSLNCGKACVAGARLVVSSPKTLCES